MLFNPKIVRDMTKWLLTKWLSAYQECACTSLFSNANMTDPACSAAFPTIGSNMMLIKPTEIPQESDAS